jgi:PIN domain nuclease of toxin-antitoxin system
MKILLDTHAWLWMVAAPHRLSATARERLGAGTTVLYLSAASSWEMSIKQALGRLDLGGDPEHVIPDMMLRSDVVALDITHQHTLRAGALPLHHRDPVDRLLIAQAQIEKLPVMTADGVFAEYEVDVVGC